MPILNQVIVGGLMVLVGLGVTFYGYTIFRLILPVLGLFFGLILGTSMLPNSPILGWTLGIFFAIAFAVLAYAFWAVMMGVAGAFVGFSLGYMFGDWIGFGNWLNVILGVGLGAVFAVLYFMFKDLMVMIWTAFAGAGIIFAGLAYFWPAIFGWLENGNWLPVILTIVVGVIGTIAQMKIFVGMTYYSNPPAGGPPYVGSPASSTPA